MDTDITPIFENDDDEPHNLPPRPLTPPPPIDQPQAPDSPRRESDPREVPHVPVLKDEAEHCSRLQDIMDPPPQPQAEYSYYPPQQMYAPMAPPQYHLPQPEPPAQQAKWDPFSSIGATAWVALGIAFIIGFVIGKLR
jgi:hypothetical protein